MPVEPIVGSTDDYLVNLISEMGAEVRTSTLDHIGIDDRRLVDEAIELPQLLFYYAAVDQRIALRLSQMRIELKEVEAREFVTIADSYRSRGERMGVDEIERRVCLVDAVGKLRRAVASLETRQETVRGVLTALRQKGYSLQLIGSIRGKEEDWLRQSFARRLEGHPQGAKIRSLVEQILGPAIK
jgi:hypothetical protein